MGYGAGKRNAKGWGTIPSCFGYWLLLLRDGVCLLECFKGFPFIVAKDA